MKDQQTKKKLETVKILVVGPCDSGKSKLVSTYCNTSAITKTIGTNVYSKEEGGVRLEFWDSSGDKHYRSMITSLYKNTDVVLLCFDGTDENSLFEAYMWEKDINLHLDKTLKYLVKTKVDLNGVTEFTEDETNVFNISYNRLFGINALDQADVVKMINTVLNDYQKKFEKPKQVVKLPTEEEIKAMKSKTNCGY